MEIVKSFVQSGFEPSGDTYLWRPEILWSNVIGDAVIAFSFFIIPIGLWYFVHKRKIVRGRPIFILFASFILLCGVSHVLDIISVWYPVYWLQSLVKVSTGVVSLFAAAVLIYHVPVLLKIPSVSQMASANEELKLKTDKLKAQNEFLRNLAYATYHDLREPIRGMAINSQVLMSRYNGNMNEEMREIVKHISNESKRMFSTVDAILKLTFMESEKYKLESVDLNSVLQKTVTRLSQQIKANKAAIIPENLPMVQGNENLLCILFENVIANSIYFRSAQIPEITIDAFDEGRNYKITISDNGTGFNNEYRNQVFEMFKTLGNSAVYRGPGLGLAMSRRIAHIHRGNISADSAEGRGTTITIILPKQPDLVKHNMAA